MATIDEAIKRLTWVFTSTGADKVADDNNKVADSQTNLAASAVKTEQASLSLEKSFDSLERRYVTTVRAQQDYAKVQDTVNAAVKQNPELQERANVLLDAARAKFDAAKGSAAAFNSIIDKGREVLTGYALEGGAVGGILGSFGPWGVAAAAAIGLISAAFDYLNEQASKFGESAIGIKNFADATGLSTTEVRGLSEAAAQAGIAGDQVAGSFEKFTANLETARTGTGALFDSIAKINPALAVELASTRSGADAWDILAKAINSTTDATTRAALAKAALGKGGVADVPVLITTDQAGGLAAYSEEVQKTTGITGDLTRQTAILKAQIDAEKKAIEDTMAAFYALPVLQRQKQFLDQQKEIVQAIVSAGKNQAANFQDFTGGSDFGDSSGLATRLGAPAPQSSATADKSEELKSTSAATAELTQQTDLLTAAQNAFTKAATDSTSTTKQVGDQLLLLANAEKAHIAALSGAATGTEILQQRTDALSASLLQGTISAEDYNRALHGDTASQIAALQDQANIINAVGVAQKQAAQYAADYNSMLRAGKEPADALAIAAAKLSNSQDATYQSAQKMVQSSQDNLDKIQAQGTGMEAVVASSIAYRDAIQAGATATQAAAIASNTLEANLLQAAKAADQMADAATAAFASFVKTAGGYDNALYGGHGGSTGNFSADAQAFGGHGGSDIISTEGGDPKFNAILRSLASEQSQGGLGGVDLSGGFASSLAAITNAPNTIGADPAAAESLSSSGYNLNQILGPQKSVVSDKVAAYDSIIQAQNSQTADPAARSANIQMELSWLRTLPLDPAVTSKMVELTTAIGGLTTSTNSLNATNQDLLSPYYTQDPRTSHIGFRSQGMASGGDVTVPGGYSANDNMLAVIPVASGETIAVRRPGQTTSGSTQTISVVNHITIAGNANRDEIGRTMYQTGQNTARQLQAAGR